MCNQDQFLKESINEQRRSFLKYSSVGFASSYLFLNSAYGINSVPARIPDLNMLDFGAKGDGVNDDSFAFQRACDVAAKLGGARIHLPDPDKYYRLLFPVYLSDNTEVFGQGESTKILFEDPLFVKGRGGFVIGSSKEANREYAKQRYLHKQNMTTINPNFKNPEQRQYLRDNPKFLQAENSVIHDLYIESQFTQQNINDWGGYGINFVNARNCHTYNIWGRGWTQLIGMGSDVPPETPSNHNCSARNLHVISPDLKRTYYSIGFIANSTNCVIESAQQHSPMTPGSLNGSGVATNLCEDCIIKNIQIPDLGKTVTSEGVLINNSSGCSVENILIGNARTAVSVFYSDAKTLNPEKPNYFSNIKGINCEVVLAVYSKFNVIRSVSGVNSMFNILLKNANATNNSIYSSPEDVAASKNLSQHFLSVHKFITSQLR